MRPTFREICFTLALLIGVAPLWASHRLPLVDLPQHLHLISVLHRLHDPTTLYPQWFALRGELTPYLGYYYAVSALHWLMPLELANRVFLSLYVAALPLSLAFLLRSLGRPSWPALLALPFAYGDSLAWGFVNYICALPLGLLCCGFFLRALTQADHRRAWALGLSVCLVATLLFHVQVFLFLALALPALLLSTRAPEDEGGRLSWKARGWALLGLLPGVTLFLIWVGLRLGQPAEVETGAPWKAWGPLLSSQNLAFKSVSQNLAEFPQVLANQLRDQSDRTVLWAVLGVFTLGWVLGLLPRSEKLASGPLGSGWIRLALLAAVALGLFLFLPFDIRGYMYYLNTRYAHLLAALLVCLVPAAADRFEKPLLLASVGVALLLAVPLCRGFAHFGEEARPLEEMVAATGPKPKVAGLIFDPGSRVVSHPVYLHAAAELARAGGGVCNFSFALTPHSPLRYARPPPPTMPSEWRADQFDMRSMGPSYDHFLVRGPSPERLFVPLLGKELSLVARAGNFSLLRRP